MRIAALYDIHGNLPALEAVLHDIQQAQVDQIVVGGDVIPGPMPYETLQRLRAVEIPTRFIMGNGDFEVLQQMAGTLPDTVPERLQEILRWVAQQLPPEDVQVLSGWADTIKLAVDGLGDALFCHATPRNNTEVFTRQTSEARLLPVFAGVTVPLVVCGHTHMQFDRTIGPVRVVNAGSVGMPYGRPGARWLLLGPQVEFRRTDYDLAQAAEQIRRTGYPQAQDFADNNVLSRPSEAEALQTFTQWEL